ncbi:MAG: tRNA (guanosine(46)-N(7))-methyltransferase TrmB [Candidatus Binatia bacterium]
MNFGLIRASRDFGRDDWLAGTACERVEIEIGPGNCGYLLAAARRDPACLHVGIEVQASCLARVRDRARSRGLLPANLRLLEGDGGWIVRHLLAAASVDAFHVYFPDPWWKKRHHKRRIFQADFCQALGRTLVPGGAVHVVTDVAPLFAEITERMEAAGFLARPWDRETPEAASAYEHKYRRQGRHFQQAVFTLRVR